MQFSVYILIGNKEPFFEYSEVIIGNIIHYRQGMVKSNKAPLNMQRMIPYQLFKCFLAIK